MTIILRCIRKISPPSSATHGGATLYLSLSTAQEQITHFKRRYTNESSLESKLVLYSYWQSSCAWRVRFALNLKGLPYEYRAVNIALGEQFTPEFEKLNPLHMVPVLADGDVTLSDSYAILLYLEDKYPQKALLPVNPQQRALNLQKHIEDKFGAEEQNMWA